MAVADMSGIYEIVNLVNGKRYIGSAKYLMTRLGQHRNRLKSGTHHNRHLQQSWIRHGADAFRFTKIAVCRPDDLAFFEQRAIDVLRPEFNICPNARSSLGRRHSTETREKIAASKAGLKMPPRSAEHRAAISRALSGKKKSDEHMAALHAARSAFVMPPEQRKRVSRALKASYSKGLHRRDRPPEYREKIADGLRGRQLSEEHRANVSAAMIGRKRGPYKLDPAKDEARKSAGRRLAAMINEKRWGFKP